MNSVDTTGVIIFLVTVLVLSVLLILLLRWCMHCEALVKGHRQGPLWSVACACGSRRVGRFCAKCGRQTAGPGAGTG